MTARGRQVLLDVAVAERAGLAAGAPRKSAGDSRTPPPADPDEQTILAVDTRTPYTTDFDGGDAGKTAHYPGAPGRRPALDAAPRCQGVSTTDEKGPPALDGPQRTEFAAAKRPSAGCQGWSETASATIRG